MTGLGFRESLLRVFRSSSKKTEEDVVAPKRKKSKKSGSKRHHSHNHTSEKNGERKKSKKSHTLDVEAPVETTQRSSKKMKKPEDEMVMTWTPEDITKTMKGMPVPDEVLGMQFLLEVGDSLNGWHLDFRKRRAKINRYPIRKLRSKKPPRSSSTDIPELQALPWIWYKNRRFFTQMETGLMSLKIGIIRKKIAVGDIEVMPKLSIMWDAAKEKSTARKVEKMKRF